MERHQGYLTAPHDVPLPLTNGEMAVLARFKPKSPEGNTVPMPKNPDWIKLPFKDVWTDSRTCRRILYIDYMFERAAMEALRLKAAFGCARRHKGEGGNVYGFTFTPEQHHPTTQTFDV